MKSDWYALPCHFNCKTQTPTQTWPYRKHFVGAVYETQSAVLRRLHGVTKDTRPRSASHSDSSCRVFKRSHNASHGNHLQEPSATSNVIIHVRGQVEQRAVGTGQTLPLHSGQESSCRPSGGHSWIMNEAVSCDWAILQSHIRQLFSFLHQLRILVDIRHMGYLTVPRLPCRRHH